MVGLLLTVRGALAARTMFPSTVRCAGYGCRDHAFVVTFLYRIEYPPARYADRHLPLADQFYHFDLDAYCAALDRVIEIASFECR